MDAREFNFSLWSDSAGLQQLNIWYFEIFRLNTYGVSSLKAYTKKYKKRKKEKKYIVVKYNKKQGKKTGWSRWDKEK